MVVLKEFVCGGYQKKKKKKKKKPEYLRAKIYSGLKDVVHRIVLPSFGRGIVLPSSFTGGPRYMIHN